jgi:hypothetical protein
MTEHQIRGDGRYYYGGSIVLSAYNDGIDGDAVLVWTSFEGGTVSLQLDIDELQALEAACSKLREEILAEKPWLAS